MTPDMPMATQMMASMGPMIGGLMVHAWFDLITFVVVLALVGRLGGGRIMYPILFIGIIGLIGFLTMLVGTHQVMWLTSTLKSIVLLIVAVWFVQIFKP